jgi:hypothetical protein
MQPIYEIRWSDEFIADVTAICGDLRVFDEAFTGFDWYLCRLPRGPGTWDLSPIGDLRLAHLPATRLEDGTDVPAIYFTFQLRLGGSPYLDLLRAFRWDDDRLYEVAGGPPPPRV